MTVFNRRNVGITASTILSGVLLWPNQQDAQKNDMAPPDAPEMVAATIKPDAPLLQGASLIDDTTPHKAIKPPPSSVITLQESVRCFDRNQTEPSLVCEDERTYLIADSADEIIPFLELNAVPPLKDETIERCLNDAFSNALPTQYVINKEGDKHRFSGSIQLENIPNQTLSKLDWFLGGYNDGIDLKFIKYYNPEENYTSLEFNLSSEHTAGGFIGYRFGLEFNHATSDVDPYITHYIRNDYDTIDEIKTATDIIDEAMKTMILDIVSIFSSCNFKNTSLTETNRDLTILAISTPEPQRP